MASTKYKRKFENENERLEKRTRNSCTELQVVATAASRSRGGCRYGARRGVRHNAVGFWAPGTEYWRFGATGQLHEPRKPKGEINSRR